MRTLAPVMLAAFCVIGCNERPDATSNATTYQPNEARTVSPPTNDASYKLLEQDPDIRMAALQALIIDSGHACSAVVKSKFEGGLDGSDEWRVDCADTGPWAVWFRPADPAQVERCSSATCN